MTTAACLDAALTYATRGCSVGSACSTIDVAATVEAARPRDTRKECFPMHPQSTTPPMFGDPRLPSRFWNKVEVTADGCWLWRAAHNERGYGNLSFGGKPGVSAYRLAYNTLVGSVPDGLELDHICRAPACVNPHHLEIVTHRENILRGNTTPAKHAAATHCRNGHPFDLFNTHYTPQGKRTCRICMQKRLDTYMRRTRPKASK